jgi:hypothetical protein
MKKATWLNSLAKLARKNYSNWKIKLRRKSNVKQNY